MALAPRSRVLQTTVLGLSFVFSIAIMAMLIDVLSTFARHRHHDRTGWWNVDKYGIDGTTQKLLLASAVITAVSSATRIIMQCRPSRLDAGTIPAIKAGLTIISVLLCLISSTFAIVDFDKETTSNDFDHRSLQSWTCMVDAKSWTLLDGGPHDMNTICDRLVVSEFMTLTLGVIEAVALCLLICTCRANTLEKHLPSRGCDEP